MSPVDRYQENLIEATPLEKELAFLLQEIAFQNYPVGRRPADLTEHVAPLYLEQARVLSHNHVIRNKIRLILDNNSFARLEAALVQ